MLVLTVREGDVIVIGDNVRVMVRQIKKGMFKACFDAPQDVSIRRLSATEPPVNADDEWDEAEMFAAAPVPVVFVTTRRRRPGANRG